MRTVTIEDLIGRPLNNTEEKNSPGRVYVQGPMDIPLSPPRISVVGTRRPTGEGVREAQALTRMLVDNDATVVSGLAAGIDATSHKSAIEHGGRTVAVLGTPLNVTYPASNRDLQARIADRHLVVSQFSGERPVTKKNFVMRNRTMALISDASVIVEAGEDSGTRHQGWEAIRMKRPLFVCGPVARRRPKWLEEMEDYGAITLENYEDILDVVPHNIKLIDVFG